MPLLYIDTIPCHAVQAMPLIEEIPEDEPSSVNSSSVELLATIKQLAARLALPEELLSSYIQDDSSEPIATVYWSADQKMKKRYHHIARMR